MTASTYHEFALHPRLRPYVSAIHGYQLLGFAPGVHVGLPSPALTFIISLGAELDVTAPGEGRARGQFSTLAGGLHDAPALIHHDGNQAGIQLGLTPAGARALLGLPAAALAGQVVDLEQVWGPRAAELAERVRSAQSWAARGEELTAVLLAAVDDDAAALRPEVAAAWTMLTSSGGRTRVADVAREVGWSRRHLAQCVRDELGLGPKTIGSVARFDRARHLVLSRPDRTLAMVAAACGYADQAHMNREWRRMVGASPTAWRQAESLPFLQDTDVGRQDHVDHVHH